MNEIIDCIDEPNNTRIAKNLGISKVVLEGIFAHADKFVLRRLDYKIHNLNQLSHDESVDPVTRASVSVQKFGKLGESEVITPKHICKDMIDLIDDAELRTVIDNGNKVLDIAGKAGEFALAVFEKYIALGYDKDTLKDAIYTIPTSGIAYEFTRMIYEILDLNVDNIASKFNSYSLLRVKNNDAIDYTKISALLKQNKPFNTITMDDEISEGDDIVNFSVVVGNPPYQEESKNKSNTNGQAPRTNIFHHFQIQAENLSSKATALIFPGIRWIHQSGKGVKQFGKELINSPHLKKVIFYPNAKDVFDSADVQDGVSIVLTEQNMNYNEFTYEYIVSGGKQQVLLEHPGEELIQLNPNDIKIVEKIKSFVEKYKLGFLHDSILPRSLFGIESDFAEKNQNRIKPFVDGQAMKPNEIKILTNNKAGSAGRSCWYVCDEDVIRSNTKYIKEWQVVVSSAHPGGQDGRGNQIAIIDNKSAFGRARVALKSFETKTEAENFYKYANCHLIKYAFLMSDEALSSLAKFVPDLMSYTPDNQIVDFSESTTAINDKLCELCKLTSEEINYIESKIKPTE